MPQTPPQHKPLREVLQNLRLTIGRYLDTKSADVEHKDIIKELYGRTEMTGTYMASLIFANLIALLGLLSNSVAVVIGAMLISPLMGPIFSLGLSFAMGHLTLAHKAGRIIAISVIVTVAAAVFLTILSPLKEATPEILSRTRPNIYDLLIASFAGAVGAIALCTRKNYLFTTSGIAIATAVIPPLSVVGYGIGTLQFAMAMGGFLLFFTNLVAIVISSDIVFMLLRFRSSMIEESKYPLKLRLKILGVTLLIIAIPLITILVSDLRALKLSKKIELTLKSNLNVEGHSRLTGFSIQKEKEAIKVLASVNTVSGIDVITEKRLNKELSSGSSKPIVLELEQILVKAGTIEASETPLTQKLLPSPLPPPKESLTTLRGKTLPIINDACTEAGTFLAPWPVRGCAVTFSDGTTPTNLQLTVGRDFPLSDQEQRWLALAAIKKLGEGVTLVARTSRLLPDLMIGDGGVPDEKGKKELAILKELAAKKLPVQVIISYPGGSRKVKVAHLKKAGMLKNYLIKELALPTGSITLKANGNAYRITVDSVNNTKERQ